MATFLGLTVSIAANVAHSFVPPKNAPANWSPHVGAILLALFWPIAVYVVIEVFARALRKDLTWWTVMRYVALAPVALMAAIVSYNHLSALMRFYGETHLVSSLGPLAVDGLMIMGTGALIAVSRPKIVKHRKRVANIAIETPRESEIPAVEIVETPEIETKPLETFNAPKSLKVSVDRAPSRSRLDQVELVKANIPDWDQREVTGPEITMVTQIKGGESIQKIKDVLYPDSPTALRRAARREGVSA